MEGWVTVKTVLRITYSNKKVDIKIIWQRDMFLEDLNLNISDKKKKCFKTLIQ